jgi:hypothetical protein
MTLLFIGLIVGKALIRKLPPITPQTREQVQQIKNLMTAPQYVKILKT